MKKIRDIMIFTASDVFASVARRIIQRHRLISRAGVIEATGEHMIRNAKEAVSTGVKVLIARGRNVWLLEENMPIPMVDVPYPYEETYESTQMGDYALEGIALIGFNSAYDTMLRFRRIFGTDVQVIDPKSPDTIKQDVIGELRPGTRPLIGGFSVKQAAGAHELRHVMLRIHSGNVETATDRALNILVSMKAKDEYLQTILATINGVPDAILDYLPTGELLFLNDSTRALFRNRSPEEILHLLSPGKEADRVLNQKEPVQKSIANLFLRVCLVNYRPIIVSTQLKSVVIIVGSGNRIQSVEKQIHMKLSEEYPAARYIFLDIVGESAPIKETIRLERRYAVSNSIILISGETGTGKEVFAQSIHNASGRANEPLVATNCATPSESILRSELFSYVKEAFIGTNREGKMGLFELARGGTVFLDKIGEMNTNVQVKLLHVLQEKEISRLGDNKIVPIDARVIGATNKNLEKLAQERKFREDLFCHLNALELCLPSLRERKKDIPRLIEHYTRKNCSEITFSKEAVTLLQEGAYPGNIRQFFNLLRRAITLSESACIGPGCSEGAVRRRPAAVSDTRAAAVPPSPRESVMECERGKIQELLACSGGNWVQAIVELNISTTTLRRKMKKYRLISQLLAAANQSVPQHAG